jgi:hypothetical protein
MRRRHLLLTLALLALPLPALAEEQPEVLAYYWLDSGGLPPEYAWSVEVAIATDGKVTLKDCKGYETEPPGCKIRKGKTTPERLQAIRDAVAASGLVDKPARPADEVMVGGGSAGGKVLLDGMEVPLISQPAAEDAARVGQVLAAIRDAMPRRFLKFVTDR